MDSFQVNCKLQNTYAAKHKNLGGEKECLGQFQGWDKFIQRAVSDKRATAYIEMGEVTYPILNHNVYK